MPTAPPLEPGRLVTREQYDAHVARTMTEKVLEERVRQLAHAHGWRRYHTLRPKGSPAGFPDDVLVRDGRLIFAELKTEKGKTSPAQDEWLEALGAVERATSDDVVEVYVWRPSDLLAGRIDEALR